MGFGLVQSKPVMKEASMLELGVSQNAIVLFCFGSKSVVVYFSTATNRRSRGALWSIIAPPFIRTGSDLLFYLVGN